METYTLNDDLKVFGSQVKSFPNGIKEAFEALMKTIPEGKNRSYLGLSQFANDGSILYYAAAEETFRGEGDKYNYDTYTIEKGDYLTEAVHDWRKKTNCIKDVFHEMMQNIRIDKNKPCVEWYKSDDEMFCMIKMEASKNSVAV